ncbi:hypothetical protein [Micromonospora fulviviridis]|uniref:hypothetical protein n=1 Tax=Micromonospora fulviviridis TaxID=47860 RepID=UPI0037B623F5
MVVERTHQARHTSFVTYVQSRKGAAVLIAAGHRRPVPRADAWPPGPPLALLGCRPRLSGSFEAELAHVRVDGTAHTMGWGQRVFGSVVATRPSTLGDDLVDVMLEARIPEPMAASDRPPWDVARRRPD